MAEVRRWHRLLLVLAAMISAQLYQAVQAGELFGRSTLSEELLPPAARTPRPFILGQLGPAHTH
jgi:hypothetical protein